jgi:hypothetical protein
VYHDVVAASLLELTMMILIMMGKVPFWDYVKCFDILILSTVSKK